MDTINKIDATEVDEIIYFLKKYKDSVTCNNTRKHKLKTKKELV